MRKPTLIALAILALMLGACASTNDTADRPEHTTASNDNPTELPSMAEKQNQIAYTDISASASTKEVVVTEKPVLDSSASVTYPTDQTMISSSTTDTTVADDTATMSGTTSTTSTTPSSTLNTTTTTTTTSTTDSSNSSMTSSSTTDDTDDDDDTATASRTRLRKD